MDQLQEVLATVKHLETARLDDKEHIDNKFHEAELARLQIRLEVVQAINTLKEAVRSGDDRVIAAIQAELAKYTPREIHDEQIEALEDDTGKTEEKVDKLTLRVETVEKHLVRYAGAIGGITAGVMAVDKLDLLQKFLDLFNS